MVEVGGHTAFKLYPKTDAGQRTIPLPDWLTTIIADHRDRYPLGTAGLIYPNQVGKPLRRTLFRARIWRPTLVRAGLLGHLTQIDLDRWQAEWTDHNGQLNVEKFPTYHQAVTHIAHHTTGGLRFHDLRHSYATWLVDDGVPINMVQRVMGHERSSTTLDLYTRRTDHHSRIRDALNTPPADPGDDAIPGVLVPIG